MERERGTTSGQTNGHTAHKPQRARTKTDQLTAAFGARSPSMAAAAAAAAVERSFKGPQKSISGRPPEGAGAAVGRSTTTTTALLSRRAATATAATARCQVAQSALAARFGLSGARAARRTADDIHCHLAAPRKQMRPAQTCERAFMAAQMCERSERQVRAASRSRLV